MFTSVSKFFKDKVFYFLITTSVIVTLLGLSLQLNNLFYLLLLYFLTCKLGFWRSQKSSNQATDYFLNNCFQLTFKKRLQDFDTQQLFRRVNSYLFPNETIRESLLFYQNNFQRVMLDTPVTIGVVTNNRIILLDFNLTNLENPQTIDYNDLVSMEIKQDKYFDSITFLAKQKAIRLQHIIKGNTIKFAQATKKPYQVQSY